MPSKKSAYPAIHNKYTSFFSISQNHPQSDTVGPPTNQGASILDVGGVRGTRTNNTTNHLTFSSHIKIVEQTSPALRAPSPNLWEGYTQKDPLIVIGRNNKSPSQEGDLGGG